LNFTNSFQATAKISHCLSKTNSHYTHYSREKKGLNAFESEKLDCFNNPGSQIPECEPKSLYPVVEKTGEPFAM